jgi:hypothetical protein
VPEKKHDPAREEYRSMTDVLLAAGAVATPAAIVAQPVVAAWADEHFSKDDEPKGAAPPPQKPEK